MKAIIQDVVALLFCVTSAISGAYSQLHSTNLMCAMVVCGVCVGRGGVVFSASVLHIPKVKFNL